MCCTAVWAGVLILAFWVPVSAQEGSASQGVGEEAVIEKEVPAVVTVAVLDFEAKEAGGAGMGAKMGDLLTIYLSTMGNFEMVDRSKLNEVLSEFAVRRIEGPSTRVKPSRLAGWWGPD